MLLFSSQYDRSPRLAFMPPVAFAFLCHPSLSRSFSHQLPLVHLRCSFSPLDEETNQINQAAKKAKLRMQLLSTHRFRVPFFASYH